MINVGVGTGRVSEKNAKIFGMARPQFNCGSLYLEDVFGQGRTCDLVNRSKGDRHSRQGLAQGSMCMCKLISVSAGCSLQQPRSVRFRRQHMRHELREDRVKGHGKQVATCWANLAHTSHHRQLPTSDTRMLDACSGIRINQTEEALQSLRDGSPFQDREDPPVINVGVGTGRVSEKNAKIFGIARPCGSLYLEDVFGQGRTLGARYS